MMKISIFWIWDKMRSQNFNIKSKNNFLKLNENIQMFKKLLLKIIFISSKSINIRFHHKLFLKIKNDFKKYIFLYNKLKIDFILI